MPAHSPIAAGDSPQSLKSLPSFSLGAAVVWLRNRGDSGYHGYEANYSVLGGPVRLGNLNAVGNVGPIHVLGGIRQTTTTSTYEASGHLHSEQESSSTTVTTGTPDPNAPPPPEGEEDLDYSFDTVGTASASFDYSDVLYSFDYESTTEGTLLTIGTTGQTALDWQNGTPGANSYGGGGTVDSASPTPPTAVAPGGVSVSSGSVGSLLIVGRLDFQEKSHEWGVPSGLGGAGPVQTLEITSDSFIATDNGEDRYHTDSLTTFTRQAQSESESQRRGRGTAGWSSLTEVTYGATTVDLLERSHDHVGASYAVTGQPDPTADAYAFEEISLTTTSESTTLGFNGLGGGTSTNNSFTNADYWFQGAEAVSNTSLDKRWADVDSEGDLVDEHHYSEASNSQSGSTLLIRKHTWDSVTPQSGGSTHTWEVGLRKIETAYLHTDLVIDDDGEISRTTHNWRLGEESGESDYERIPTATSVHRLVGSRSFTSHGEVDITTDYTGGTDSTADQVVHHVVKSGGGGYHIEETTIPSTGPQSQRLIDSQNSGEADYTITQTPGSGGYGGQYGGGGYGGPNIVLDVDAYEWTTTTQSDSWVVSPPSNYGGVIRTEDDTVETLEWVGNNQVRWQRNFVRKETTQYPSSYPGYPPTQYTNTMPQYAQAYYPQTFSIAPAFEGTYSNMAYGSENNGASNVLIAATFNGAAPSPHGTRSSGTNPQPITTASGFNNQQDTEGRETNTGVENTPPVVSQAEVGRGLDADCGCECGSEEEQVEELGGNTWYGPDGEGHSETEVSGVSAAADPFQLGGLQFVGFREDFVAKLEDKFAAIFKGNQWKVHHVYQRSPALVALKTLVDGIDFDPDALENLRGVPAHVHQEITTRQNQWWKAQGDELVLTKQLDPKNARQGHFTVKQIIDAHPDTATLLKQYDELVDSIDSKYSKYWVAGGASLKDAQRVAKNLECKSVAAIFDDASLRRWEAGKTRRLAAGFKLIGQHTKKLPAVIFGFLAIEALAEKGHAMWEANGWTPEAEEVYYRVLEAWELRMRDGSVPDQIQIDVAVSFDKYLSSLDVEPAVRAMIKVKFFSEALSGD